MARKLTITVPDDVYREIQYLNKSFLISFLLEEFLNNLPRDLDKLELIEITARKDKSKLKELFNLKAPAEPKQQQTQSKSVSNDEIEINNIDEWW